MSDRVQELQVFVRVAESASFSQAARDLHLSQPSISRIMSELEARLGVKLLLRSTRQLSLTEAGADFLTRAKAILAAVEEAEDAARGVGSLRGTIRLALPIMLATHGILPHLPAFLTDHPMLEIEIIGADARQDLVADGVDMAIRSGKLSDSAYGARRLGSLERWTVAAPAYLAARGTPRTPGELAGHDCLFGPGSLGAEGWCYRAGGKTVSVDVSGRLRTNSGPITRAAAEAGLGIAIAFRMMCADAAADGRLVRILANYDLEPVEIHALYPGGPRPPARVRALTEHIIKHLPARV